MIYMFVEKCSKEELVPVIHGKVLEDFIIHTDGYKAYDGFTLNGHGYCLIFHIEERICSGETTSTV